MTDLSQFRQFYLMGIKGVAMTSLAQILLDFEKKVSGCDVAEDFVTQKILSKLNLKIDYGFTHQLPDEVDCVVYTAAHGGIKNPIVVQALEKNLPVVSQAEALAYFFNQKKGIAVCGVGGKTTVSAMVSWILEKNNQPASFSIGVGEILGLINTGRWNQNSEYFVAEADEYVINPEEKIDQSKTTPRFSFLNPIINVCTNLEYDHPDVYHSLEHTKDIFTQFFLQTQKGGSLIINQDNSHLVGIVKKINPDLEKRQTTLKTFGKSPQADAHLLNSKITKQKNYGEVKINGQPYVIELNLPGDFNLVNALTATLTAIELGIDIKDSLKALKTFQGTQRRFEFVGVKKGVIYYDDYAHHPHEITQTIQALKQWFPSKKIVIAFQPHTYSRTKAMLPEFVSALSKTNEVLLLDIFPSAREQYDPNISSDVLVAETKKINPKINIVNLKTIDSLLNYCLNQLKEDEVLLTMGAGDIYKLHDMI